ncbi:MAG: ABC transporter permease [Nitrososphaerales archaeon]
MSLWRTLRVAWEGLTLNKVRSLLTTLGVIIGVAAVIIMMAVSAGAEANIADRINSLGANLLMITPNFTRGGFGPGAREQQGPQYDDIAAIAASVPNISGVSAERGTVLTVKGGGNTVEDVQIIGTTPGFQQVRDYALDKGRFITDEDNARPNKIVVLGSDLAQSLFGAANPVGQKIKVGTQEVSVIGVMKPKGVVGNTDYDTRLYMPLQLMIKKFMRARFGGNGVGMIYVSAANRDVMPAVQANVTNLLIKRHDVDPTSPDFSIVTQDNIIEAQASTTATFRNLLAWVAAVSLLVGGIGIMNIMLVSVTERTREIGLRQALGARQRDVRLQFLIEALMLSLAGGLVGVLVGVAGSYLFAALGNMRTTIVPASVPLAFAAAAAIGIFFGYYPATKAAQLDPIEALRRE